jgi:hypothetical protein
LRLTTETVEPFGIGRKLRAEDLEGHLATEPSVACAVDFAHAARAER